MLCQFSKQFPHTVARFLEMDRTLKRNFREESVTDLFLASLISIQPYFVKFDFPIESKTGADMEWIFAAPRDNIMRKFLIQSKRAKIRKTKRTTYGYYNHLDYGKNHGDQAKTLMNNAGSTTLCFYMFYHPLSILDSGSRYLPDIEGVNIVPANYVFPIATKKCSTKEKYVSRWRKYFLPLHSLLCFPEYDKFIESWFNNADQYIGFIALPDLGEDSSSGRLLSGNFHPDFVAKRVNRLLDRMADSTDRTQSMEIARRASPEMEIAPDIRRSIHNEMTDEDRNNIQHKRIIFWTQLTRDDDDYRRILNGDY